MWHIFTEKSTYKKGARFLAVSWTLLILFLCFLPGNELPDVKIPFIDKWAHVILFAGFSFFWLCGYPSRTWRSSLFWLATSIFLGWLVEYIQGHYAVGRYQDNMDTLADAVGGLVGIIIFVAASFIAIGRQAQAK